MYPTKMEANGHIYPINTDYRVALACFRALDDDEITDLERFYAVETLLLGSDVLEEDEMILKDKIALYLKCEREDETSDDEIDFDYFSLVELPEYEREFDAEEDIDRKQTN